MPTIHNRRSPGTSISWRRSGPRASQTFFRHQTQICDTTASTAALTPTQHDLAAFEPHRQVLNTGHIAQAHLQINNRHRGLPRIGRRALRRVAPFFDRFPNVAGFVDHRSTFRGSSYPNSQKPRSVSATGLPGPTGGSADTSRPGG
jgi:RuvB AAA lid domain